MEQVFRSGDLNKIYENVPAISIDYGLMEKSGRVAVVPLDLKWSDLGSFDAFFDEFPRDESGNITFNGGILLDAAGNLLYTGKGKVAAGEVGGVPEVLRAVVRAAAAAGGAAPGRAKNCSGKEQIRPRQPAGRLLRYW